jgi:hypothetical protein
MALVVNTYSEDYNDNLGLTTKIVAIWKYAVSFQASGKTFTTFDGQNWVGENIRQKIIRKRE